MKLLKALPNLRRIYELIQRLSCILFILLLAGFILSCEKHETNSQAKKDRGENVLRFDLPGPINTLDPSKSEAGSPEMLFPFLYSYLFVPNEDLQMEPDLATGWTYDSKTFTWTIQIRNDVVFHDKRPLTSSDVIYSLETILSRFGPSVYQLIEKITPLETGLSVSLKRDDPDFLIKISPIPILPQPDEKRRNHASSPVGSGPFRFSYKKGEKEVGLVANVDYYRGRPSLDGIVAYFEPDKENSWSRLISGKTDLVFEIDVKDYELMKYYQDKFYLNMAVVPFRTLLLFNTADPLFVDPKVRRALAHAVRREYIVDVILRGMGMVCAGTMGYYSPFRDPELQPIGYDPQQSLQLLREAGWSFDLDNLYLQKGDRRFEFTILFHQDFPLHERIGEYIRLCLHDIGIRTRLQPVPFEELQERHCGNTAFQSVITEYADFRGDPTVIQRFWCPINKNRSLAGCFEDPRVTRLIGETIEERDPLLKKRLFHELDSLLTSLQPAIFLYQRKSLSILSKRFRMSYPFSPSVFSRFHLWKLSLETE